MRQLRQKSEYLRPAVIIVITVIVLAALTGCLFAENPNGSGAEIGAPGESAEVSGAEIEALYESVSTYVSEHGLEDSITLQHTSDLLLITLRSDAWFSYISRRVEVMPDMQLVGADIARMLADSFNPENPFLITVTGHTESVPVHPMGRYSSFWALSFDWAASILEILVFNSHLDPRFFYARGCGEESPIADNNTPEGRQANRRIEITVSLGSGLA